MVIHKGIYWVQKFDWTMEIKFLELVGLVGSVEDRKQIRLMVWEEMKVGNYGRWKYALQLTVLTNYNKLNKTTIILA